MMFWYVVVCDVWCFDIWCAVRSVWCFGLWCAVRYVRCVMCGVYGCGVSFLYVVNGAWCVVFWYVVCGADVRPVAGGSKRGMMNTENICLSIVLP